MIRRYSLCAMFAKGTVIADVLPDVLSWLLPPWADPKWPFD